MPVERGMSLLVELIERSPGPETAREAETRTVVIEGDGFGGVGLELYCVGAGCGGCIDEAESAVDVAIVIARHLRDDVWRVLRRDPPAVDGNCGARHRRLACCL